jgi:hypothetical protein
MGAASVSPGQLRARQPWGRSLRDEEIAWGDKRHSWAERQAGRLNDRLKHKAEEYLANGEIGVAATTPQAMRGKFLKRGVYPAA